MILYPEATFNPPEKSKYGMMIYSTIKGSRSKTTLGTWSVSRTFFWEKNALFWALPEFPLPPTPSPHFGQLVQLFSDVRIQDLKVSLGLKVIFILYLDNLKDSSKFKLLALEEMDSFFDQKCTPWKCAKKLGQGLPPPSFGRCPKNAQKNAYFSQENVPKESSPLYGKKIVRSWAIWSALMSFSDYEK